MSWLFSSLTEGVLASLTDCTTSVEVWKVLSRLLSARTKSIVLQLKTLIQTTRKSASNIIEFYNKIKTLADELKFAGSEVTDEDPTLFLLANLGLEYDSVVNITTKS